MLDLWDKNALQRKKKKKKKRKMVLLVQRNRGVENNTFYLVSSYCMNNVSTFLNSGSDGCWMILIRRWTRAALPGWASDLGESPWKFDVTLRKEGLLCFALRCCGRKSGLAEKKIQRKKKKQTMWWARRLTEDNVVGGHDYKQRSNYEPSDMENMKISRLFLFLVPCWRYQPDMVTNGY